MRLGPINIICEAPNYPVCEAAGRSQVGVIRSLDVPWFHKTPKTCHRPTCNDGLKYGTYEFTSANGRVVRLSISQCKRCFAVYWAGTVVSGQDAT